MVPAFNESAGLPRFVRVLTDTLDGAGIVSWELLLVDDGSTDLSWAQIGALNAADPRVEGIRLSRNFGHQRAQWAGLAHARGRAVITMDADLEHPPELIPELVERWREGYAVVQGIRADDPTLPWPKRLTSRLFYRIYSLLSGQALPPGSADFRLIDRAVVQELLQFREEGLFLRGLVQWVGFRQAEIPFVPGRRTHGTSHFTTVRMLRLAWSGVSSFSVVPLRLAIFLGFATAGAAFLELVYALVMRLGFHRTAAGWASLVAVISFLFGMLFILLGIIGEYLGRVLSEVQGRPRYIVRERLGAASAPWIPEPSSLPLAVAGWTSGRRTPPPPPRSSGAVRPWG